MKRALAAALCALAAAACAPHLELASPAPPNRFASLLRRELRPDLIEVSEGVAIALQCTRAGAPCRSVHASVSDPRLLGVHDAHVSSLAPSFQRETNATDLVVVGLSPGTTTLHVEAEGHSTDFDVEVMRAPEPPARR